MVHPKLKLCKLMANVPGENGVVFSVTLKIIPSLIIRLVFNANQLKNIKHQNPLSM